MRTGIESESVKVVQWLENVKYIIIILITSTTISVNKNGKIIANLFWH